MWDSFWAGLLMGLILWVLVESVRQLIRPRALFRAGGRHFVVIPAAGKMERMELLLRQARHILSEEGSSAGGIFVVDRGMSEDARRVVLRFNGTRLCEEKDLGLLAERLPKADPRRQGR